MRLQGGQLVHPGSWGGTFRFSRISDRDTLKAERATGERQHGRQGGKPLRRRR
jgi:hypothetical protein